MDAGPRTLAPTRDAPPDWVDPASAPLGDDDYRRLRFVDQALARSLKLKQWWRDASGPWAFEILDEPRLSTLLSSNIHPITFRLTQPTPYWPETMGYGFFDTAVLDHQTVPIYGFVQQATFVQAPSLSQGLPSPDPSSYYHEDVLNRRSDGFREFVWKYFLRVTHFVQPYIPYSPPEPRPLDAFLRPFSWKFPSSGDIEPQRGVTNRRLYYKLRRSQKIGKFRKPDENDFDLRDVAIDGDYSWVVFSLNSHTSDRHEPLTARWPPVSPFNRIRYGVVSHHFMSQDESRKPGERKGLYTLGFALDGDPVSRAKDRVGFVQIQFVVQADGSILARIVFVRPRPQRFVRLDDNPFAWVTLGLARVLRGLARVPGSRQPASGEPEHGPVLPSTQDPLRALIGGLNAATDGWTARNLGFSTGQLQTRLLIEGAIEFLKIIDSVLLIWQAVPDWTAEDRLPDWVR